MKIFIYLGFVVGDALLVVLDLVGAVGDEGEESLFLLFQWRRFVFFLQSLSVGVGGGGGFVVEGNRVWVFELRLLEREMMMMVRVHQEKQ